MNAKVTKLEGRSRRSAKRAVDLDRIARGVRLILEGIGEDPDREGLRETPQRVAEMYAELTAGMREDPSEHVIPLSGNKHDEMVIVKNITIASLCEHHLADIANTLFERLRPVGVMVVIEAEHACMTLRGVKKSGAMTVTSAVLGGFRKDPRTRAEAMALITGK
jgi:GTP cyclohydrolase I